MTPHPHLKPGYVGKLKNGDDYECFATDIYDAPVIGRRRANMKDCWKLVYHQADGTCHLMAHYDIDLPPVVEWDWSTTLPWFNALAADKRSDGSYIWYLYAKKPTLFMCQDGFYPQAGYLYIPPEYAPKGYTGTAAASLTMRPGGKEEGK